MINYSFIIPHYNNPELLNRLLDSIPQREDIEIIVVDDNSEIGKKPIISRSDIKIIYINENESKGAGNARNIGLDLAEGKWLLFADCDDFYEKGFINILDEYRESDNDIVFFCAHVNYDPLTPQISLKTNYIDRVYTRYYNSNKSEQEFRRLTMTTSVPWNKMFNHAFITEIGNRFECVPVGNDAWFSKYAGSKARKIAIIKQRLYYYVKYNNNTTNKKRPFNDYYLIINSSIRRHKLLKQYGLLGSVRIFGFYPQNVKRDFGYRGLIKLVIYCISKDPTFASIILEKIKSKIKRFTRHIISTKKS